MYVEFVSGELVLDESGSAEVSDADSELLNNKLKI